MFGDEYKLRICLCFTLQLFLFPECSGREAENYVVVLPTVNTGTIFHTHTMFLGVPGDVADE
jgi:hypothetical protein